MLGPAIAGVWNQAALPRLVTNHADLTCCDAVDDGSNLRHQRLQGDNVVSARVEDDHADVQPGDILLELQVAINGNEAVNACCGELQQPAVLYARPTQFDDGPDRVRRQFLTKAPGNALVKQHAHAPRRDRQLSVAPQPRYRGQHWESRPGIPLVAPRTPDSRAASEMELAFQRRQEYHPLLPGH